MRGYEHDRDGNLTRETLGSWNLLYGYDGEDRLINAQGELLGWTDEGPQPERIDYTYDALGRRLSRDEQYRQGFDTSGVDTYYLYDGRSLSVAAELREIKLPGGGFLPPGLIDKGGPPGLGGDLPPGLGGDNPGQGNGPPGELPPPFQGWDDPVDEYSAREYVLLGTEILSHTDLVSRPVHKSQTSWYHADVRGSTMMLTGENGQRSAAYSYDAYGSVYGERPVVGVPRPVVPETARPAVERGTEYLYTGKRLEAETGLVDYGYRDYAPRLARFTTVDPIRDGRNWYAYVGGDPVNRVDLWGLEATDGPSATYRALVGASLALGPAVAAEIGYVTDTEGGFGIAMTVAGGTGVQGSIDVGLSTIISIILEVAGGTALSFPETIEGTVADLAGPVQFAEAGFIVGIQVDLEESELSGYTIGLSAGGGAYWGYRFVIEF